MNEEKLRSDWDALTKQEKEEFIQSYKQAFEALKNATIVFTYNMIKGMPELLKSLTNDFTASDSKKEGVS